MRAVRRRLVLRFMLCRFPLLRRATLGRRAGARFLAMRRLGALFEDLLNFADAASLDLNTPRTAL